jgi:arginyl-tRNA synthetase
VKTNPREVATKVVAEVSPDNDVIDKLDVAGPGFVNIFISKDFIAKQVKHRQHIVLNQNLDTMTVGK